MELKKQRVFLTVLSFIICFILLIDPAPAAEPAKVIIFPFNIHSQDDLSFLNTGIINILSSRLAKKDKVVIVKPPDTAHPGGVDEVTAIKLASDINADYVVIGSLTVFGNSVSIDAATRIRVVDFADGVPSGLFFGDDAPGSVMVGVKDLSRFYEGDQRVLHVVDS